jgi:pyruvate dehydrogenase E1 component beta subunit
VTYKEEITAAMDMLAQDPLVRFVGYGVRYGGKAMGTLKNVPESQLIETPVAENLMVGIATGMALKGFRPVVFIERCDFILNAMDAIVNHLEKIKMMSGGQFAPAIILRVVIGNKSKPLFTGETHTQDFSKSLDGMLDMPVYTILNEGDAPHVYEYAAKGFEKGYSTMVFEQKDLI